MRKKILGILFLLLFLGFFIKPPQISEAMLVEGGGGGGLGDTIYITQNNYGTTWRTRVDYTPYGGTTTTYYGYTTVTLSQNMSSNDKMTWYTACVDPESNISISIDVSCRSYDAFSTTDCKSVLNAQNSIACGIAYGACGGPLDSPSAGGSGSYSSFAKNLGTVPYSTCPIPNNHPGPRFSAGYNNFRCAYQGYVSASANQVGCENTCTYRYCNGSSWVTTAYSNQCGGNAISGSYLCGSNSYSCSPPAPSTTVSTTCSGGSATISVSHGSVSHSDGTYDLRYKKSGASSYSAICSPTNPQKITGLASNTVYNIGVRGNTTSGYNGPTAFSSVNITTGDCALPDLDITSFTFPSGYAGDTGTASVTVKNIGYKTASNFIVKIVDGVTSSSYTQTVSSLAAGASTTLNYTITEPTTTGTFTATATADSGNTVVEMNESNNTATSSYTVSPNTITVNVYKDNNGNGFKDTGEPAYSGATVSLSGPVNTSGVTNANGQYIFNNLKVGSYNVILTVPSGYTSTTTNPAPKTLPPPTTVNFGIQPPAPTCTGITAQSPIYQRATSQVTSSGCKTNSGQTIDYTWSIPVVAGRGDTISGSSYTSATYTAGADARQNGYETLPNLQVCNPGLTAGEKTTLCNNYATKIDVLPLYTISGYVYVDTNKDRIKQAGESNTAATVTVTAKNSSGAVVGTASVPTGAGAYTIAGAGGIPSLPAGQYTVSITAPAGYIPTTATSLTVNVGTSAGVGPGGLALTACSPLGAGSLPDPAACDAKGDITNLNFGISNSIPWIQTGPENPAGPTNGGSGDTNMPNGWNNFVPAGTCGPVPHYVSLNGPTVGGGATPGVISVGSGSFNFCPGGAPTAGGCQNSASSTQWVAGGLPSDYPSSFSSVNPGIVRTSYNYLLSIVKQAGITPTPVTAAMFTGTLAHGVYQSTGDLTLGNATGGTYTFPTGDFVVLVNGNLYLKENIKVAHGSTVLFSVSGSIYVDPSVGEGSYTSYATDIEGFYSADKDFVIQGGNGNNCPTGDKRINIGGSVVVNASLNGGTLSNQRDLCGNDLSCPTIYVAGRPDFLLNAPLFFMNTRRIWQEVAPNQ